MPLARAMTLRASRASILLFAVATFALIPSCSTDSASPAGPCVHNSDCDGGLICLFGECATVCVADRDCPNGSRCLRTTTGSGCVTPSVAECSATCPGGTTCGNDKECRTDCTASSGLSCLDGQACDGAQCVGLDAAHDMLASSAAGAGGASGGAGASGIGGLSGSGGSSAASGASGSAGSSGSAAAGASGAAGSVNLGGGPTSPACGDTSGFLEGAIWPFYTRCTTHMTKTPYPGPTTSHVRWMQTFPASVGTITILPSGDLVVAAGDLSLVSAADGSHTSIATGGYSEVALAAGGLILGADGMVVHAFDVTTHVEAWTATPTLGAGDSIGVIVPFGGHHAVLESVNGTFATIDTTDGTVLQTRSFGDTLNNFATMNADGLMFIADTANVHIFDPLLPNDVATTPPMVLGFGDYATASNGWFLYQTNDQKIAAVDATGASKLLAPFCGSSGDLVTDDAGLAISGDCMQTGDLAIDVTTGASAWTASGIGAIAFSAVIDSEGHVYGVTNGGVALAIDVQGSTGSVLWSSQMASAMPALVALAPSVLYAGNGNTLYAFGD